MTSASLMYEAGHSKLMLWDNSEEWCVEGGGKEVHDWRIHVQAWLITLMCGKKYDNIIK